METKSKKKERKKEREFRKNIYFASLTMLKPFDCVDHKKKKKQLQKILKDIEIPNHHAVS